MQSNISIIIAEIAQNLIASETEIRIQIVPQEFKGNAYVVTEHKAVLHADGVVGIPWIPVHQALKDHQLRYPMPMIPGANT